MVNVSVITPTYNRGKYIKKCIESVLNQTLKNIELIIIDDGSTDNTFSVVKQYDDSRIKYVKQENKGIGKSRNYGVKLASGKYIVFLDSDDYLENDALEKMYDKAEKENIDIVVSDFYDVYLNSKKVENKIKHFENSKLIDNPDIINDINLGPSNKLYKKELFDNTYFPENIKYEDMPLVTLVLKKANLIGHIETPLFNFLMDNVSETTVRDEKIFDIFKSLDMTISNFKEKEYETAIKELVISKLANYIIQQRYQKDKALRNKFIDEAYLRMEEIDHNYKKNNYFKKRSKLKALIEKHKMLSKIYCAIYTKRP